MFEMGTSIYWIDFFELISNNIFFYKNSRHGFVNELLIKNINHEVRRLVAP